MAKRVALLVSSGYAALLTIAGFPAVALLLGCVIYLTLTSLFGDRPGPSGSARDQLNSTRSRLGRR